MEQHNCKHCRKVYTRFRKTGEFCCGDHRTDYFREHRDTLRKQVLEKAEGKCCRCDVANPKMYVRALPGEPKTLETLKVYCGSCNSRLSKELFWKRVPPEERTEGYKRRTAIRKKMEREGLNLPWNGVG